MKTTQPADSQSPALEEQLVGIHAKTAPTLPRVRGRVASGGSWARGLWKATATMSYPAPAAEGSSSMMLRKKMPSILYFVSSPC